MRVLFVPSVSCPIPHLLPLIALASRLDRTRHEAAFLVSRTFHGALEAQGAHVLDIDYDRRQAFRQEMLAYQRFKPDVVVDDLSPTALLSTTMSEKPRVAIRRTGVFPDTKPRSRADRHSAVDSEGLFDIYKESEAIFGIARPSTLADVCAARVHVVPGIRTIEVLPAAADDSSHVFAGSLVAPDATCARVMEACGAAAADEEGLARFFDRNQQRLVVCFTIGTTLRANESAIAALGHILARGAAVVSSVPLPALAPSLRECFFHAPFLPMHRVCSHADLMIHHCGSGTYQYQIQHTLPAICIGTGYYDRDDVAARLAELGVSQYIPPLPEAADVADAFRRVFDACADTGGAWYQEARRVLTGLLAEDRRAVAAFDADAVLRTAIARR